MIRYKEERQALINQGELPATIDDHIKNIELERGVSKKVAEMALAEDEHLVATDKQID